MSQQQRAEEVMRRYLTESSPLDGKREVRVASLSRLRDGMLVDYEVISDALTGFRRMGADVQIRAA